VNEERLPDWSWHACTIAHDADDSGVFEKREIKICRFFGLIVEPQGGRDFLPGFSFDFVAGSIEFLAWRGLFGGGLEIAMGFHYRVAVVSAQVGQPEVKLGIIPGAAGTQRLPRLAGVAKAVQMCADGNPIGAKEALNLGILDRIVEGDWLAGALSFVREKIAGGEKTPKTRERNEKLGDAASNAPIFDVMRLLEIVRGKATNKEVIATSMSLAKRLKKVGVLVGNCYGFVGNRMLHQYGREANFLVSWLIAIKGVEWFVRNTPRDLHVLPLFIKPAELQEMCARHGLTVTSLRGLAPKVATRAFINLLLRGRVDGRNDIIGVGRSTKNVKIYWNEGKRG
jgi:hypothetical protein